MYLLFEHFKFVEDKSSNKLSLHERQGLNLIYFQLKIFLYSLNTLLILIGTYQHYLLNKIFNFSDSCDPYTVIINM